MPKTPVVISPDTRITVSAIVGAVTIGTAGIGGVTTWLNGKFEYQKTVQQGIITNVTELKMIARRAWSIDHMQVWTDMYRQTGAPPDPFLVLERLRAIDPPQ